MLKKYLQRVGVVACAATLLVLVKVGPAEALNYDLGKDTNLDVSVALTYGAAWRVEDQNKTLLANINGDDGNRDFDQGDMINNRLSTTIDMDLNYKRKYGIFLRPRAYYDFAYEGKTANDSPGTWNNNPPVDNRHFDPETRDAMGRKAEILDAYVYGSFDPGNHHTELRVGRQVVSWGESLFIPGISASQGPVDATAANSPGVEVKDILLPVGQVYGSYDLLDNVTLAAYYQFEWEKTRLNEAGSFFSTTDFLDKAGRRFLLPGGGAIIRGSDDQPSDQGQYGVAMRYIADWLNDTEFGLYFINYHDKAPEVIFGEVPGQYFLRYAENIKLYGLSIGTAIGSTNIGAEVSYKANTPLLVKGGYQRGEALQAQVSVVKLMGGLKPLWDNLTLTGEMGINRVAGPSNEELVNDRTAWGGTIQAAFDYFQVLPLLDLKIPINYKFNPHGVSSVGGTFAEQADSLGVAFNFTYQQVYQVGFAYTAYVGGAGHQSNCDRDFVSMNLKYTF